MTHLLFGLWLTVCQIPCLWFMSAVVLLVFRDAAHWTAKACYHEVRPFYWPLAVLATVAFPAYAPGAEVWQVCTFAALFGLMWMVGRRAGDDDDRWKRRKARLLERVSEVAGRLVVEPAKAEA